MHLQKDIVDIKNLLVKIDTLNFSTRCFHCLDKNVSNILARLVMMSENDLKNLKNLGEKVF